MSVSGLKAPQRAIARERFTQAMILGQHHAAALHYSESASDRWEGINQHCNAKLFQYPTAEDCSSFFTWGMWNALFLGFKLPDTVNNSNWKSGWTGTLAKGGLEVIEHKIIIQGDAILYGEAPDFEHVAGVIGHKNGKPIVCSNGSEDGPYILPYDYRSDIGMVRRYI